MSSWITMTRGIIVLALLTVLLSGYAVYLKGERIVMEKHLSELRAQLPVVHAGSEILAGSAAPTEPGEAAPKGGTTTGDRWMENEELLKRVAGESDVEIVNLLKTEISDRYDSQLTYRLRVRADMERLINFLQVLEHWGLDRVVIDRVSAKRRGDVWETNLEVTSYFGSGEALTK